MYTEEDDNHLVNYLAHRIPLKTHGGRFGHKIYKDLVLRVSIPSSTHIYFPNSFFQQTDLYPWAARHSWQSWLERYKKNANRLDPLIEEAVEENNIDPYGKGVYLSK